MALSNTSTLVRLLSTPTRSIDLQSVEAPLTIQHGLALPNGTGAGQADLLWTDQRTIAASGTDDLDLAGTFTDVFGQAVVFARVKALLIKASSGNTNNVVVGNAAATQFLGPFGAAAHTLAIQPGGVFFALAPGTTAWAVAAGSADLLRIANSGAGTGVTYDIAVLGCSA